MGYRVDLQQGRVLPAIVGHGQPGKAVPGGHAVREEADVEDIGCRPRACRDDAEMCPEVGDPQRTEPERDVERASAAVVLENDGAGGGVDLGDEATGRSPDRAAAECDAPGG